MMRRMIVKSEEVMLALGRDIGRKMEAGEVLLLEGDLGVGKTTLAKGIAAGLGIGKRVNSPTFVVMKVYENANGPGLVHVDAYRLSGSEDLAAIGFDEYLESGFVGVVEWPENVTRKWPSGTQKVALRIMADGESREITFEMA